MSSKREGASLGSLNHTRPVRSHTYILPLLSKVSPTASVHGPETLLSVKPGGTVDAATLPATIGPVAVATKHVIATARLIRARQTSTGRLRWLAGMTRR